MTRNRFCVGLDDQRPLVFRSRCLETAGVEAQMTRDRQCGYPGAELLLCLDYTSILNTIMPYTFTDENAFKFSRVELVNAISVKSPIRGVEAHIPFRV